MKNSSLKIGLATSVIVASASATIYIAPPDMDSVKQKTDQVFYDMYQNENSAIAKGANKELKDYVNNIKTKNKLFEGDTIVKVAQGYSQGTNIKANTSNIVKIFGDTYRIVVNDLGDMRIVPTNPKLKKYIKANSVISRTGSNAIQIGKPKCSAKGTKKVGKSTYSVCKQYTREAVEATFNVVNGELIERAGIQVSSAICKYVPKGKSSYFQCKPDANLWSTSSTKKVTSRVIDIQKVLKGEQSAIIKIKTLKLPKIIKGEVVEAINNRGGKTNNQPISYRTHKRYPIKD